MDIVSGGLQLLDHENDQLSRRVADAMKTGHYPSASDAKLVDDQLHRAHLSKRRKKLEVCIITVGCLHVVELSLTSGPCCNAQLAPGGIF